MRKLFLFIAALTLSAGMWAQEINAVKFVQGATTDWYMLSTTPKVTMGTSITIAGKSYDLTQGDVTTTFGTAPADLWQTVRTDGVADNWNTICLEKNITAIDGATFWTVSGQDANFFILDEVTEPQAGYGYLIRFTKSDLKVQYGNQVAEEPVTADEGNPIQGTYTQIDFDQDGQNELVGNYVVYNNQLCKVEAWERLLAHRAYVVTNHVPDNAPAPAPDRARAYMPKQKETPTELEMVDDAQCTMHDGKFLRNGQLIIVKDKKMYNAQGMRL